MKLRAAVSLVAITVIAGCDGAAPVVIEAGLVTDTFVEAGPYEVRAVVYDESPIASMILEYAVDDDAEFAAVPMAISVELPPPELGTRIGAKIPGQVLGSIVHWHLVVCDTGQRCTRSPEDGENEFRVGPIPSEPAIASLSPNVGPQSGGTRVEIHGSDFRPGARAFFGDVEALHVEWLRLDLIAATTARMPAPGVVDVRVENPDGPSAILEDSFTFLPSPVVDGVNPDSGPERGDTPVVITGRNFAEGSRGFFDGVPCRRQVIVNPARLECETPPGRPGLVDVEVRHPDNGFGVLEEAFEYIARPRIDVVAPEQGTSEGGTEIVIVGSGFREGAVVLVDGAECTDVVVISDTELSCLTPPGIPGIADVEVINTDGQSGVLPGGFSYLGPPVVIVVVPDEAPIAGGVDVRVLGAGFDITDEVLFAGERGEVLDAPSDAELVVRVPALPGDTSIAPPSGTIAVDVTVRRTDPLDAREGTLEGGLTYYWPPEIEVVSPSEGPTAGGTEVIITGRFFRIPTDGALVVRFDGVDCVEPLITSSTTIACLTPPGDPGFADVEVENHPLSIGFADDAYFYVAPPRVDATNPTNGPTFGGERTRIIGAFFRAGALVFFDGAPCTDVTFVNETLLECTTPPGEEGFADVRVVNPDGQEDTAAQIYEYLGVAVTPNFGLTAGFTRVRVRSAGMANGAVVRFDGVAADCVFISSREMSCNTPAHAPGPVNVAFRNPDGTGEDSDNAFTYKRFANRTQGRVNNDGGRNATHVELVDFDQDGDLDAAVSNGRVGQPEVSHLHVNDGAADFERLALPVEATANKVDVGDSNNDGRPDLLFAASDGLGAILVENLGGNNVDVVDLALPPTSSSFEAQLVDLVGDARDDLLVLAIGCDVILDAETNPNCDPGDFGPEVLFEQRDLGFIDRSSLIPHINGWTHDHKMVATDLDLDGDRDLVVVVNNDPYASAENRVFINRVNEGQGFVVQRPPALLNLTGDLYDIGAGDVDRDGDPDVVTTVCNVQPFGGSEVLLINDGGNLTNGSARIPGDDDNCYVGTLMLDVDTDGDLDIFYGGTEDFTSFHLSLYVNTDSGDFVRADGDIPLVNRDLQVNHIAGGDLDRDGDPDIMIAGGAPYLDTGAAGALLLFLME